jgi:hypothetical protein
MTKFYLKLPRYKNNNVISVAASYRLVNGSSNNNGRVEVNLGGQWGTVCDDHFDVNAAKVLCKSLHLP